MSLAKVFLGVMTGLAAGALLGVLFSPEKGSDTRKRISKKGEDYGNTLKKRLTDSLNSISKKLELVKIEISNFSNHANLKSGESDKDVKTKTS